jgi:HSP20 family protein
MANIALRKTNEPATSTMQPYSTWRGKWEPTRWFENILGWDPFRELYPTMQTTPETFAPDFELKETTDSYVVIGDLPGVSESDLDISLRGNQLAISGKREQEDVKETSNYFCCERSYGSFLRTFTLPQGVRMEDVRADLKDGVLQVIVPKSPELQPRKIAVGTVGSKPGKINA